MIHYDPHNWLDHFFDIRGSLVREISLRVAICVLWSTGVVAFHKFVFPAGTNIVLHSLVGVALGLLLVFRTNASYDRYWEGRKLWGGIVNESRNLIRAASIYFHSHDNILHTLTRWTALFPVTTMNALRGSTDLGPGATEISSSDLAALTRAQHPALFVAQRMTACLDHARSLNIVSDHIHVALDQNIQLLIGYLGGCERIRKTPLPFAYVVHLRRALIIYCFTLPFALVETFGWFTILDVLLISYTFFGIEEIGVEIEGPFGYDENDLPMEDICATVRNNIYALAGISHPLPDKLPDGL